MKNTTEVYHECLNRAVDFIERNLDKKILLKDVAREAYLSEFHFHRIFKSFTGETVKEFLSRLRVEKAAVQLKHGKNDIGQIAFEAGFVNHETFTRAFKRFFQVTPQEYRDTTREVVTGKRTEYLTRFEGLGTLKVEEPTIVHIPELHLAYIRHTGSYDKVAPSFQRLMLWAATHLVLKWKPVTLGIVHDDPDLTDEDKIRYDACVIVSKPVLPKGEIGYKHIEGGKFARFRYSGPYEDFYTVYDYIYNVCLFDRGWELADKPALEWYVKSPPLYKPQHYVTDFYVPVK